VARLNASVIHGIAILIPRQLLCGNHRLIKLRRNQNVANIKITGTIFINDGSGEVHSFVCATTSIDVSGLSPGQTVEITGFSGQFANDFEVDPRTQADIRVIP
jgi:DNA/RNA endonuclease YhcR with UshA esterase domain